ncbi:uncharacterized protein YMR317W-like [Diprion similis]|uniref:uncharacterized protein YMR317W-like n=1 Tax=Diprion similis TaxID=362088 RepID=UPI001EF8EE49|nr:uncharacterized protein YMR317W-like [Diprion similis]
MSLRDVCMFLCVVLGVQALPLPHRKFDPPNSSQEDKDFYRMLFSFYNPLREPIPGSPQVPYDLQSPTNVQQNPSRLVIDLGQDTRKFHQKPIPKFKPVIDRFGNPIWLHKKGVLSDRTFKLIASAAKERLKQTFLRQQDLIDKMHSFEWRDKFGQIPFDTMNEDHVIVKRPGAHFDVIFPPNTEVQSNSSSVDPVIGHQGISGLHQVSEILTTFPVTRPATADIPEVDQAVEIIDSFENYGVTKPRLPFYDSVSIEVPASTMTPTESILENIIFDATMTESPFTESSGATVESETIFETVGLSGIGDEETVDAEAATHHVEILSSTAPSKTTLKTEVTWLEPLQDSQTTVESEIQPASVASSVIDVESIAKESFPIPSSMIIDPTPSIAAEEFTSSILGTETTSQVPSTTEPNSLIDTVLVTEETIFESPVLETTVEEHGIGVAIINANVTYQEVDLKSTEATAIWLNVSEIVDGSINDSQLTIGVDSTFLASTLPSKTTSDLEEIYSTDEKLFDITPIKVEITDETTSRFSSVPPIEPFTPLDDVTIDVVTSFDSSRNDAETSTNVVWMYPAFIFSTEVSFNLNDTVYGLNSSLETSIEDAEITADITSSSSNGVPTETGINWNKKPSMIDTVFHTSITEGEDIMETVSMLPETPEPFVETFSTSGTLLDTSTNDIETTTIAHWTFVLSTFSTEVTTDLSDMSLTTVTPYQSLETEVDTTTEMVSAIPSTILTATTTILEETNENEVRLSDLKYDLEAITNIISTTPTPTRPTEKIVDSNEISLNADVSVQTITSRAKVIVETVTKSPTSTVQPASTVTYDKNFVITNAPFETLSTSEKTSTVEVVSIYQPAMLTETTTILDGTFTLAGESVNSSTNDAKIIMDAPAEKDTTLNVLSTIGLAYPSSIEESWTISSVISEQPMIVDEILSNTDSASIRSTGNQEWTTEIVLTSVADIREELTKEIISMLPTHSVVDVELEQDHLETQDASSYAPASIETNTEIIFTSSANILPETDDSINSEANNEFEKGDEYPVGRQDNRNYVTEDIYTDSTIGSTSYENTVTEVISTDTLLETNDASTPEKDLEHEQDSRYLSTNEENNGYATATTLGLTSYGEASTATILTTPTDIALETTKVLLSDSDTNVEEGSGPLMENQAERADYATASSDYEETTTEIVLALPADILTETDDSLNSAADDEVEKGDEYPVGRQDNRDYATENTDTVSTIGSTSYENTVTEIMLTDTSSEIDDRSNREKDLEHEQDSRYLSTNEENNGYTTATTDVTPIDLTSYGEAWTATVSADFLLETPRVLVSEDDTKVEEDLGQLVENHDESYHATTFPEYKRTISEVGSAVTIDDVPTSVGDAEVEPRFEHLVQGKDNSDYSEYETGPDLGLESPRSVYNSIVTLDQKPLLSLIPLVIEELRENNLNTNAKKKLSEIFGDLWPLMVDEANRSAWEFMNHQLATILFEADQHVTVDAGSQQHIGINSFINTAKKKYERSSGSRINQEQAKQLHNLHDLEREDMNPFLQVQHQWPRRAKKDAAMDPELKSEVSPQTGYMESDPVIDADDQKFSVNVTDKSSSIREVPKV